MMGNKTMNPPPCELILEMSVLSTHAKKKSSEGKKKKRHCTNVRVEGVIREKLKGENQDLIFFLCYVIPPRRCGGIDGLIRVPEKEPGQKLVKTRIAVLNR